MDQTQRIVLKESRHFVQITKQDREKIAKWLQNQEGKTRTEKRFLELLKEALQKVTYDCWIATMEPSVINGKILYAEGEKVGVGFSCRKWKEMAEEYEPKRGSRLAKLHELFIWYALRIVNEQWSLDFVANNSSDAGNYWDSPHASKCVETSGRRECGGYCDGIGNTDKIVTIESDYAIVGGDYSDCGDDYVVSRVFFDCNPENVRRYGSGILVLTK